MKVAEGTVDSNATVTTLATITTAATFAMSLFSSSWSSRSFLRRVSRQSLSTANKLPGIRFLGEREEGWAR
jgi:hypothetical protein